MTDLSELEARLSRLEQRVDANSRRVEAVDSKADEFRQYRNFQKQSAKSHVKFWIAVVLLIASPWIWRSITALANSLFSLT
jgi:hypothetical protein